MKKVLAWLILLVAILAYVTFGIYCYNTHEPGPFIMFGLLYVFPGFLLASWLGIALGNWAADVFTETEK